MVSVYIVYAVWGNYVPPEEVRVASRPSCPLSNCARDKVWFGKCWGRQAGTGK